MTQTSPLPPVPIPQDLADLVSDQLVSAGERQLRILGVNDLVRFSARQPKDTEAPYWAIVWEASIALAQWLSEHPGCVRGKRLLELGCGLGLSGIVAALLGAEVTQTDKIPLALRIAHENARRNGLDPPPRQFRADWQEWTHEDLYDVLLGSDLVYEPGMIPWLVPLFRRNLRSGGAILLSGPLHRDPVLELIDRLFADGWHFETESRVIAWQGRDTEIGLWIGSR